MIGQTRKAREALRDKTARVRARVLASTPASERGSSSAKIARETRVSERTARRHLIVLMEQGHTTKVAPGRWRRIK